MQTQTTTRSTLGPLRWEVSSATTPGVTYEVAADTVTGELRCNCLAGQRHKTPCWHVKAVASGAMGKPKVRYQPKPRLSTPALSIDDLYALAPVVSGPITVPAIPIREPRW